MGIVYSCYRFFFEEAISILMNGLFKKSIDITIG